MKILIVEDDEHARDVLDSFLSAKGYQVTCATDGLEALECFKSDVPDVVLLDITMPKLDGWEVLDVLRAKSSVPVIMVTARDTTDDVVKGLSSGVDDYIVKPFKLREVEARIQAVLRRVDSFEPEKKVSLGALSIDDARKQVFVDEEKIDLSPKEYDLLKLLASKPGHVFSDMQIIRNVWPEGSLAAATDVKRYIHLLRQKIEPDPQHPAYVKTVRGFGYSLETP